MTLGDLSGFGDAAVRRKIVTRLNDPDQFQDLMVELSLAAWHQSQGHSVTPFENKGWPDLKVIFSENDLPILLECKRVRTPNYKRLADRIKEANWQIRQVSIHAYGIVVIDVTAFLSKNIGTLSDETPEEIEA